MEDAGRWALARRPAPTGGADGQADAVEHVARTLLRRYGVVFWRLLEREAAWLPPWRDLLRVYRRLEGARRDPRRPLRRRLLRRAVRAARGGRHAARGPPPDAVRRRGSRVSGADPLNLVGILTPGPKLAALTGNRLLYRDGVPVAMLAGGEVQFLETLDPATEWEARKALLRGDAPAPSICPDTNLRPGTSAEPVA